uniref:SMP-LTD domain-containing protein n=1 Tax=Romanomermis culicivorax TaxID=13658 RepID=A0A915K8U5_ROMCU
MIIAHCIACYLWKIRQTKRIALQQAASWEKDLILTHLKDLPSWVHFPDSERVEWINKVIYQLWPNIARFANRFIKNVIEPEIKAHLPSPLHLFTFQEIDIGTIPLRLGGIKVYTENVGRDKIIIDADVAYAGDCNFVIYFGPFKGGLRQIQLKIYANSCVLPDLIKR